MRPRPTSPGDARAIHREVAPYLRDARRLIGTFYQRTSHVLFALFTVMLVLARMELAAHDMHAYEMHAILAPEEC